MKTVILAISLALLFPGAAMASTGKHGDKDIGHLQPLSEKKLSQTVIHSNISGGNGELNADEVEEQQRYIPTPLHIVQPGQQQPQSSDTLSPLQQQFRNNLINQLGGVAQQLQ